MPPKAADMEALTLGFIFSVLKNCESVKPDWGNVAKENGISYGRNAQAKFKGLLEKHGYKLEDSRIIPIDPNATPPPPKQARIQKTPKTPKTISASKRKDPTNGSNEDPTPTKKKKATPKIEPLIKEEQVKDEETNSIFEDEAT